jgi:hypothetical protein
MPKTFISFYKQSAKCQDFFLKATKLPDIVENAALKIARNFAFQKQKNPALFYFI